MCGICGIINFDGRVVRNEQIQSMMASMKHRGPDDEGFFIDDSIGLGHVRLSILDLSSAGHQPMVSEDGRYYIVHNGEVYNYIELREELRSAYPFYTNTDTEVILNAYRHWGKKCLEKFNGMFAFAIYDQKSREIFAARDRFGIKPFYYYKAKNVFIFASEIPAILSVLDKRIEPDEQSIFDYLIFNRTDHTEHTFFKDIRQLRHAHCLTIKESNVKIEKWYNLADQLDKPFSGKEEFREVFSSAVGLRLRSDVPVGVCLSGGLDSSSIVSVLINDYEQYDINTFSAVYGKGVFGDESKFIEEYSSILKNMHYTLPTVETLLNDLDRFVNAHAEPLPSTSTYAQFKVMELAKGRVVVVLDGQGADEQLAGYPYFFGYHFKNLFRKVHLFRLFNEIVSYVMMHRSLFGLKTFMYLLLPESLKCSARVAERGYVHPDFADKWSGSSKVLSLLYQSESLKKALLDHFEYKLEHLLKREDCNSMRFSIEARVPFLDHRLVEGTLSADSSQIINKGETKYILRAAMKGVLPEKIRVRQDKIGFVTPEDEWFRTTEFKEFSNEIIMSDSFRSRGILDVKKVKNLHTRHLERKINISSEIWKWINLELWFQKFID